MTSSGNVRRRISSRSNPLENDGFGRDGRQDRKVGQLCAQAERALTFALARSHRALVADLHVFAVRPYPSASRLLVLVAPPPQVDDIDRTAILDALAQEKGQLRSAVAEMVNRKRAPELIFELAPQLAEEEPWV